jgi:hypothetical protein
LVTRRRAAHRSAGRPANDEPAQRAAVLRIALGAFAVAVHDRAALRAASGLAAPPPAATADRTSHTALCAVLRAGLAAVLTGLGGSLRRPRAPRLRRQRRVRGGAADLCAYGDLDSYGATVLPAVSAAATVVACGNACLSWAALRLRTRRS